MILTHNSYQTTNTHKETLWQYITAKDVVDICLALQDDKDEHPEGWLDAVDDVLYAARLSLLAVKNHIEVWQGVPLKREDEDYMAGIRDILSDITDTIHDRAFSDAAF